MRQIRVLHCIWRMAVGGAERQLALLVRGLVERGADVHIAIAFATPHDVQLRPTGATLYELGGASKYDIRVLFRLFALIRRLRPDVVQTWLTQMDIFAGSIALLFRVPWLLSERSSTVCYPKTILNSLRVRIARRGAVVAANSAGGAEYWSSHGIEPERITIVPNILPAQSIDAAESISECPPGPIIVFAGRLNLEKNLHRLLQGIRSNAALGDARVIFCGDGPMKAPLQRLALDVGIGDRAVFLGSVDTVWSWMKRADAVVNLSAYEGDPNAVLEAIACSAPLVLSDIPAHRTLLDDSAALFVNADDPPAVGRAIQQTISDPVAAKERAVRARDVLRGRSSAEISARYEAIYQSLARSPKLQRETGGAVT